MRVFSSSSPLSAVSALRQMRPVGRSAQTPTGQTVALSEAARQLSALGSSAQEVDMQKVQALREAIASGQLGMDASRIADGLIASAQELLK